MHKIYSLRISGWGWFMQDVRLRQWLLDRSLIPPDTFDRAVTDASAAALPLDRVLVDQRLVTPLVLHQAREALAKQVLFCAPCRRGADAGDTCSTCHGPLEWLDPDAADRIRDMDDLARLTHDEIPRDVRLAQGRPGLLFGKYVLLDELGRGGAGVVRKAWDTIMADYVALKFLRELEIPANTLEGQRERQERIRDLLHEGRAALRLRHPCIVAIRDIGRINDQVYLAMDFVDGRTMASHNFAAASRGQISPLHEDPTSSLQMLRDVAGALDYAHRCARPIIHCDLKPGNIMINREGQTCILDYGLARILDRSAEEGTPGGTPPYMAPEQYAADGQIGPWTDLYAFGAILYELLSGRPLFKGDRFQVLTQLLNASPEDPVEVLHRIRKRDELPSRVPPKLEEALRAICLRCLPKEPSERYASAADLDRDLAEAMALAPKDTLPAPQAATAGLEVPPIQVSDSTRISFSKAIELFRDRLIAKLNEARPNFAYLDTIQGRLRNVEVLKAERDRMIILHSEGAVDVEWKRIPARQMAILAEQLELKDDEARLALGALCRAEGQAEPATRYLEMLRGTRFEGAAQALIDWGRDPLKELW